MGHLLSQDASQLLQKESTVSFGGTDQVTWGRTLWRPCHPTELALSVPLGVGPTAQPHGETLEDEDKHSSGGAASGPPASPQVMVPPEPFVPGPHQHQRICYCTYATHSYAKAKHLWKIPVIETS